MAVIQVIPRKTRIRKITERALMRRFTPDERANIRNSVDPIIIDIREDLRASDYVDLNSKDTYQSLVYLEYTGLLISKTPDEMIVDGKLDEVPESLKIR